jgi:Protein of unknown function (DUF2975)
MQFVLYKISFVTHTRKMRLINLENNKISKVLNIAVAIGILLTLLALASTPLVVTAFLKSAFSILDSKLVMTITIALYICAIPYVGILIMLKKMCKLFATNNHFSIQIPKYLKIISMFAFSEVLVINGVAFVLTYFFDMYLYALTIMPCIVISFVAIVVGLLCLVLSRLYEYVNEIKNEIDQTI